MRVGDELPPYDVPSVSAEKMKTMAALLADPTPIHFDVASLQALGMGDRPVNQGPLNMGYVMNAVTAWAGGPASLRRLRVRFLGTVLAGQHLRVRGTVTAVHPDGSADCDVVLEVLTPRQDGQHGSGHVGQDGSSHVGQDGSSQDGHLGGEAVVSGTATVVLS